MSTPEALYELPAILDVVAMSRATGLSRRRVQELCVAGRIPAHRPAGTLRYLILRDDFLAWASGKASK